MNTYKLIKTESGYTLIFLRADGSEHEHHRWNFSSKEFNATADRAARCFPSAYNLACAHARGDAHALAKPDGSTLCLTSYVYTKHSNYASASEDRLEVLRVGLEYRLYEVRTQLGFILTAARLCARITPPEADTDRLPRQPRRFAPFWKN